MLSRVSNVLDHSDRLNGPRRAEIVLAPNLYLDAVYPLGRYLLIERKC